MLTAVFWFCWANIIYSIGTLPWHGLSANQIEREVVHQRNCLPLHHDKVEPPFDIILQQGLSVFPGSRMLSVEKLREHMSRIVVDRVRMNSMTAAPVSSVIEKRVDDSFAIWYINVLVQMYKLIFHSVVHKGLFDEKSALVQVMKR